MSAPPDLRPVIRKLVAGTNLSDSEVSRALDAILGAITCTPAIRRTDILVITRMKFYRRR